MEVYQEELLDIQRQDSIQEEIHPVPKDILLKDSSFVLHSEHSTSSPFPMHNIYIYDNNIIVRNLPKNHSHIYREEKGEGLLEAELLSKSSFEGEHLLPIVGGIFFLQQLDQVDFGLHQFLG